ncbi:MAG: TetR family transcriptional regulator [Robiginitomaculum sp.]|nr:TetR family transcriptional regulator [Robiginitomaculum sp.]
MRASCHVPIPVQQIVKTLGVSVATLYRHFPKSKRS